VAIEYRWAEGQFDRLPAMAADLIRLKVAVIFSQTDVGTYAAKAMTTTIPIVFQTGDDPVRAGLVASLNQPSGNITGVTFFSADLGPKRLSQLLELVPGAALIALLIDENNAEAAVDRSQIEEAARTLGPRLIVLNARSTGDIDDAFASIVQARADALLVGGGAFFTVHRNQIIALAARDAIPASYAARELADSGGLISYGSSPVDASRRAGVYVGRVLKGDKPRDLPVDRATKVELVINLTTAKALGLTVPQSLLATADEVIE
jgi:putative ABC transport system substrate-binding protein